MYREREENQHQSTISEKEKLIEEMRIFVAQNIDSMGLSDLLDEFVSAFYLDNWSNIPPEINNYILNKTKKPVDCPDYKKIKRNWINSKYRLTLKGLRSLLIEEMHINPLSIPNLYEKVKDA